MKIWVIETDEHDIYFDELSDFLACFKSMKDQKISSRSFETTPEKWAEHEEREMHG